MAVRNFYLSADIDGRATTLSGGPRSKDGGFSATVYIRDEGGIETGIQLWAQARSDGTLELSAYPGAGRTVKRDGDGFTVTTRR